MDLIIEMCCALALTCWCCHRERNRQYAEVCSSVSGTDKYVSELVQTLKGPVKNKHVQTDCVDLVDSGESQYLDNYDTFNNTNEIKTFYPVKRCYNP